MPGKASRHLGWLQYRSLRTIASDLAALEHRAPSGQLYHASNVRPTLAGQAVTPDHAP